MKDEAIYVDVDDVLADTTATLVGLVRELFAKRVTYEDCRSFDLGESFGLSEDERDRLLDAAHEDRVIEAMGAVPGAAETLAGWEARGHVVEIVTGRPPLTLAATGRWLERMRMPHATLESVDKYGRQVGLADATPLARFADRRYRVAIEDSLSMAAFLAGETGTPVLLLDRPWNRDERSLAPRARGRIRRVTSWVEIEAIVAGLSGGR